MRKVKSILHPLLWATCLAHHASAVIFHSTADPNFNQSTPGDNSGWQFEGKFLNFLGVPIAPHHFITAAHIGGSAGNTFDLHGDLYTTIAFQNIPNTDLRVWRVHPSKPFPTYAPLSNGTAEVGAIATVFGRGTQRGNPVFNGSGLLRGWQWGPSDHVKRWGRNTITTIFTDTGGQEYLRCHFDEIGIPFECHLSIGDSGGGLFVLQDGLWRLAGIHYAVDGPFRVIPAGASFYGAIFDRDGLEAFDGSTWTSTPTDPFDVKSSFFSSRIFASLPWLVTNVGPEVNTLATESFPAWRKLYFSPSIIADPTLSSALSDPDADGIVNLIEFALHLDPTYPEPATMIPDTGIRGLPSTSFADPLLTLEFVRRTPSSGASISYLPEFSSDLISWTGPSSELVTPINPRWDRVKAIHHAPTSPARFARLRITHSP